MSTASKERVIVNEVGPRDGLQNQDVILSPQQRLTLIASLIGAGIRSAEVGAFVSPRAVPAMAGTDEIVTALNQADANYSVLVPNMRGYELAQQAGARTVNLVVAASNTMNEKNIRMNTAEAMAMSRDVIAAAADQGVKVQAYVATAWECPFEGPIAAAEVMRLTGELLEAGTASVVLADTIGAAAPGSVKALTKEAVSEFGSERLNCHFHDTRAFGVANVFAALETGIRRFDASIGGLGGCPFAPGASGNVATEDLVLLVGQEGFDTGVDLDALLQAVAVARDQIGPSVGGRAYQWLCQQAEKGRLQGDQVVR